MVRIQRTNAMSGRGRNGTSLKDGYERARRRAAAAEQKGRAKLRQFTRKYTQYLEQPRSVVFTILVWGPNTQRDIPAARKRLEIRDELEQLGHNPMMSEDIPTGPEACRRRARSWRRPRPPTW
jgi:hypothetical protein